MSEDTKLTQPPTPLAASPGEEPFINPYSETGESSTKLVCQISPGDYNYIRCIRPSQGTNTGVVGTLWKKLVNELNKRNITSIADINEFERFVANCRIISYDEGTLLDAANAANAAIAGGAKLNRVGGIGFPDRTADGNMSHTAAPSDGKRAEEPSDTASAVKTKRADIQSGSGKEGRGSGKDKKGKGTSQESHV